MKSLKKSEMLKRGDKVAVVSLSYGGAGDENLLWRYKQGKDRLKNVIGLQVVEMEHTLSGSQYIYDHPEKRAEDLMNAFRDPTIKAIFTCIGGNDSIRMIPYIDFDVITKNPKILVGYSDTTVSHLICYKAGISSVYGPTLLVDFAENGSMHPYTVDYLKKTLFSTTPIGEVKPAIEWTSEYLAWDEANKSTLRKYKRNSGFEWLQGKDIATGRLLGGCIESFDLLRGTSLFPTLDDFKEAILFLETSEEKPSASYIEGVLRTYGTMGIFDRIKGMIWGKPQDEAYYNEYKNVIRKVLKEFHKEDMPVICNLNFGHTEPKMCLPYGGLVRIHCEKKTFVILDSCVV